MPKLRADEKNLEFEGFSEPVEAYRVDTGRAKGAGCLAVVLAVAGVGFLALGFYLMDEAKQNAWLILLLMGVIATVEWVIAGRVFAQLGPARQQRVLLYPEGVVIWRDGEPAAYAWNEIASVRPKRETLPPKYRGLIRLAVMGKEFEVIIKFEDDTEIMLNAMLVGLEELAEHIKQKIAKAPPAPKPGKPGRAKPGAPGKPNAGTPAQDSGNPFDFD